MDTKTVSTTVDPWLPYSRDRGVDLSVSGQAEKSLATVVGQARSIDWCAGAVREGDVFKPTQDGLHY